MIEFEQSFPLLFVQACISCTGIALALWGVLTLAMRFWPALSIQRSVWMVAQALIGATFLLAWVPHSANFSVLPTFHLTTATKQQVLPRPAAVNLPDDAMEAAAASDALTDDLIDVGVMRLALGWVALYCIGLGYRTVRWALARRKLGALLASADLLDDAAVRAHPAFDSLYPHMTGCVQILETSAEVSPMLVGGGKTRLLLPQHLRAFSKEQQGLIVAHELTHWRRHDLLWLHISTLLQNLLWFNPVMGSLGRRLSWALELGCDQQVLAGRSQQQRKQYALALVAQLKVQQTLFAKSTPSLAFGAMRGATLGARIDLIRSNVCPQSSWLGTCTISAILAIAMAGSMLLQPAFAWQSKPVAVSIADTPLLTTIHGGSVGGPKSTLPQWRNPVDVVHVNAFYGTIGKLTPIGRHGIDFAAKMDTPVLAMADGTVIDSAERFEDRPQIGRVVVVQHSDNLRSLYAHLDRSAVKIGDFVKAGQVIAYSGASGRVTGPHLHVEALQGDQTIDPQRLLTGLDEYASKSALRARDAAKTN